MKASTTKLQLKNRCVIYPTFIFTAHQQQVIFFTSVFNLSSTNLGHYSCVLSQTILIISCC